MRWLRWNMAKLVTPGLAGELRVQAEAARMAPDRLAALQLAKLNRLLAHFRKVDFYARLLAEHGAPGGPLESLEQICLLPVATKEFLRANLANIAALPTAGHLDSTSGSTGLHFRFYQDKRAAAARMAAVLLAWQMIGMDYWSDRRFVFWNVSVDEEPRLARLRADLRRRLLTTRLVRVYGMDEPRAVQFLGQISRYRPRIIIGFPSYLHLLARQGRRRGIVPHRPAMLLCSGEKLLPDQREQVEAYFQAPLYDRYGCNEFALIAQQCRQKGVMHVPPTRLYAETDPHGELLLTDLDNTATPLIRYAIGDAGEVAGSACRCGRTGQVIGEVFGRTYDIITTPSGKLLPGQFWSNTTRLVRGVEQYQLVQRSADRLELRIVVDGQYADNSAEFFRRKVRDLVGDEIHLDVVKVDRIAPGPSGKRRFVVRMEDVNP